MHVRQVRRVLERAQALEHGGIDGLGPYFPLVLLRDTPEQVVRDPADMGFPEVQKVHAVLQVLSTLDLKDDPGGSNRPVLVGPQRGGLIVSEQALLL